MISTKLQVAVSTLIVAAALLWAPHAPSAPSGKSIPRVGILGAATPAGTFHPVHAFVRALGKLGYVEGENIHIEYVSAEGQPERLPGLAAELARRKVNVIFAPTMLATLAAMDESSGIPIVFALVSDPVGSGFVASMARPGGNITGVSVTSAALEGKRLELLKDAFPTLTQVAVLYEANRVSESELGELKRAAQTLGLTLRPVGISGPADLAQAFATLNQERAGALLVPLTPLTFSSRQQIMALAALHRLPAIYELSEFVEEGGLMSYGPDFSDQFARAAVYVAKILQGAKPGDLPVEQPTRFELMINLKTAKAIGVTIPQSVLFRADKVIE